MVERVRSASEVSWEVIERGKSIPDFPRHDFVESADDCERMPSLLAGRLPVLLRVALRSG
jgi:hypothetical protein